MIIVDEFCQRNQEWNPARLATKFGVSTQTFHNWVKTGKYEELIGYALEGLEKEIRFEERPMFEID